MRNHSCYGDLSTLSQVVHLQQFVEARKAESRICMAANDCFFIHCSPDGPLCKPRATRALVYNENCGQCEATRDGLCTGPSKTKTFA